MLYLIFAHKPETMRPNKSERFSSQLVLIILGKGGANPSADAVGKAIV
jgi:hypothetical protein